MALIKCPECGKDISDKVITCPHCGFPVKEEPETMCAQIPEATKMGDIQKNIPLGILCTLVGAMVVIIGFFLIVILIGIFAIMGGGVLATYGVLKITGTRQGVCPYCGHTISMISTHSMNAKCKDCKRQSVIDGEYLKPVA